MHLLVLSAFRLQAQWFLAVSREVSMHLLVLSAFRLASATCLRGWRASLNAPFGAQCFPTEDDKN